MKISIIIPVFNAVNTIRRAIASVDTKQNYEIICINDGSTDDSKIELEKLQNEYKHVIIINQENQGAAASRNVGLANMTGDVFMFLDADDEFLPSRIDFMADYYQQDDNVDIVIGQIGREKDGDWQTIYSHQAIQKLDKVNLAQCPDMMQSIGPALKCLTPNLQTYASMKMWCSVKNILLLLMHIKKHMIFNYYLILCMVITSKKGP